MKKIVVIPALCVLLVISVAVGYLMISSNKGSEKGFVYTVSKYDIVDSGAVEDKMFIPTSLDEQDAWTRTLSDGSPNPQGAIVICEVSGPSINRILNPPADQRVRGQVYGSNHVVTPVKISKIIYKGDDIEMRVGDVVNLIERYYYVTKETPDELAYVPMNTIIAGEYDPMEKGKNYLVYMGVENSERYAYGKKPIYGVQGDRVAVYCLSDDLPTQRSRSTAGYDVLFDEARALYGSMSKVK